MLSATYITIIISYSLMEHKVQTVVIVPFYWLTVKYATKALTVLMFVVYFILFGFSWSPFTPTIYSMPIICGCFIVGSLSVPFFIIRSERRARKLNHDRVYGLIALGEARKRGRTQEEEAALVHQDILKIDRMYPI